MGKVIDNLNLNAEWGKKYFGGETLKTPETMEFLKRRMSLMPIRNTKLIGITVFSEDKNDAARLANAIAEAYRNYRLNLRKQLTLNGIKVLEDQFQSEAEQIQAVQTNVDNLRKEFGITDSDPNSMNPTPTLSQEQLRNYNAMRLEGETRYMKLEKQLTQLQL